MNILTRVKDRMRSMMSGSSGVNHILAVSGAAIGAQGISLLVGPINSRLYRPLDYGVLAVFAATLSVFSELATMRYNEVLPIAEDETEGIHILILCFLIATAWAVLAASVVLLAGDSIVHWLAKGNPQMGHYLWFLPVGFFTTSVFTILSSWAIRKRAFMKLSVARINQSLLGSGCTVVMGLFRTGALGLLTGNFVATSTGVKKLSEIAYQDWRAERARISWAGVVQAAKRYYRYPLYTTWSAVMIQFSSQIPVLFLTKGFGSEYAGYFSLCNRILTLPATLIGNAISPVFFSRIKEAHEEGTLKTMTLRLLDAIVGIDIFFMMFLALFGDLFFSLVFGHQWYRSGQYAAALSPWLLTSFLVTPFYSLPLLFERQATVLVFQSTLLALRIGSMLLGIAMKNDLLAMWIFGGVSAVYMVCYLGWLLHLVQIPLWLPMRNLAREILLALTLFGACRMLLWLSHGNLYLTGAALVPVLCYGGLRGLRQLQRARNPMAAGPA